MASRRRFRPRLTSREPAGDRGTKGERPCGRPSKGVGRVSGRDPNARGGFGRPERRGVDTREKLLAEGGDCPYRKPTQVGEASSLRWTSETGSRNSAY